MSWSAEALGIPSYDSHDAFLFPEGVESALEDKNYAHELQEEVREMQAEGLNVTMNMKYGHGDELDITMYERSSFYAFDFEPAAEGEIDAA